MSGKSPVARPHGYVPEPLFLPRGSIRAAVGIATGLYCWAMVFAGLKVPGALLSLILAVLGYYFGFRTKDEPPVEAAPPPAPPARQPLFLPTGVIRLILSAGFLATGAFLWMTRRLDHAFLEFFVVLGGLILGYLFAHLFADRPLGRLWRIVHHVKGALVLAITACLGCILFLGPPADDAQVAVAVTVLCAAVSFYFGSRS
jgi:hypothetical protein